jgi:hypothetical protein
MGKAGYRSPLIITPNKWLGSYDVGLWEYGNYRHCYLTIRRLDNGKFKPAIGACNDIPYPGYDLPKCGYFEYSTLEEAKKHLFEYVDYIRDVHDDRAKLELQQSLHIMRPDIFPAV